MSYITFRLFIFSYKNMLKITEDNAVYLFYTSKAIGRFPTFDSYKDFIWTLFYEGLLYQYCTSKGPFGHYYLLVTTWSGLK